MATAEDTPITPVIQFAIFYGVVHLLTYLFCASSRPPKLGARSGGPGAAGALKVVTGASDPIHGVLGGEKVLAALRAQVPPGRAGGATFVPLSYTAQTVRGVKYRVSLLPDGKGGAGKWSEDAGPLVLECDIVAPPTENGVAGTPFLVEGSCRKRPLNTDEERRWWAHLIAHQAASFVAVAFLGVLGLYNWFAGPMAPLHGAVAALGGEKAAGHAARFYLLHPHGLLIGQANLAFQIYDLVATLAMPSLRSSLMVAHHVVTGGICVAICYPFLLGAAQVQPWGQFDTVYFFGLTEVSTIPLAVHDALKHLPRHLAASRSLAAVDELCKVSFAVLFLALRCAYFPVTMWGFWRCLFDQLFDNSLIRTGAADPFMAANLIKFVFCSSIFMSCLQAFWGYKIVRILASIALGTPPDDAKQQGKAKSS